MSIKQLTEKLEALLREVEEGVAYRKQCEETIRNQSNHLEQLAREKLDVEARLAAAERANHASQGQLAEVREALLRHRPDCAGAHTPILLAVVLGDKTSAESGRDFWKRTAEQAEAAHAGVCERADAAESRLAEAERRLEWTAPLLRHAGVHIARLIDRENRERAASDTRLYSSEVTKRKIDEWLRAAEDRATLAPASMGCDCRTVGACPKCGGVTPVTAVRISAETATYEPPATTPMDRIRAARMSPEVVAFELERARWDAIERCRTIVERHLWVAQDGADAEVELAHALEDIRALAAPKVEEAKPDPYPNTRAALAQMPPEVVAHGGMPFVAALAKTLDPEPAKPEAKECRCGCHDCKGISGCVHCECWSKSDAGEAREEHDPQLKRKDGDI